MSKKPLGPIDKLELTVVPCTRPGSTPTAVEVHIIVHSEGRKLEVGDILDNPSEADWDQYFSAAKANLKKYITK